MHSIHIRGGRILDPSTQRDEIADLWIDSDSGRIVSPLDGPSHQVIDATGLWVTPGLVDVHVHLREPGFSHKETIETGVAAAAAGGFTTIVAMPNTDPCADHADVIRWVMDRAAALGSTRVIQACAITEGRRGAAVVDMARIIAATGVTVFTDDGDGVQSDAVMAEAIRQAAVTGAILCQHSEVTGLSGKAAIHDGDVSRTLKIPGQPTAAEAEMVQRDIDLVRRLGGKLHVSHISCIEAIEAVRAAKREGLPVTAEVTPHHLHLTDDAVNEAGTMAKVAPPLRPQHHMMACRAALADGTIDNVATDHAPHTLADKSGPIETAAFGMVGLEIAVPMLLSLVREGVLSPLRMVDAMSTRPAAIFGLPGGTLQKDAPADVTLIHPDRPFEIDPRDFRSRGINTPFAGVIAPGRTVCTLVNGRVVYAIDEQLKSQEDFS